MSHDSVNLGALGAFVRERRLVLGLTQSQLADRVGWVQERVSVIENAKYGLPSLPALVRLAAALDVSMLRIMQVLGVSVSAATPTDEAGEHVILQYTLQRLLAINTSTVRGALNEASDELTLALGADKIDAFIYDAGTNSLVALGTSDTPMGRLQRESGLGRIPLVNREPQGQVYETGQSYRTGDARSDPQLSIGVRETLGVQSLLAVPLRRDLKAIGVLVAQSTSPDRFSAEDEDFFVAVSQWIGMIAHRAQLIEEMSERVARESRQLAAEDIITALAHDLGSLLTPLRERLALVTHRLDQTGNEGGLENLRELERSVVHVERLTANLLDLARLDHGLFALRTQPVDLAHLLRDVGMEMRSTWPEICVQVDEVPDVEADPARLREIVTTLLTNAIQHSPPNAPIVLTAGTERRDDGVRVVVAVSDAGTGIEADRVPHIFDRFTRRDQTTGPGIGLHLSRRLAEAHGGTLTLETTLGRGTTFWLTLPARPLQLA